MMEINIESTKQNKMMFFCQCAKPTVPFKGIDENIGINRKMTKNVLSAMIT